MQLMMLKTNYVIDNDIMFEFSMNFSLMFMLRINASIVVHGRKCVDL